MSRWARPRPPSSRPRHDNSNDDTYDEGMVTGMHRRPDPSTSPALARHEDLVLAVHGHRPGRRSGLCLHCGIGWPCTPLRPAVNDLTRHPALVSPEVH